MSTLPVPGRHPVTAAVARIEDELASLIDTALWSMPAGEAGDTLVALTRARARLEELQLRVLQHADTAGTGLDQGAVSTPSWWAHTTRLTRAEAHRTLRTARALDAHPDVRAALAAGRITLDQARVITDALDALPADLVDAATVARARRFLLDAAGDHDATRLRVLGRRLLEVIDPDAADAEEARRLQAEEADAHAAATLTLTDDGHGRVHGRFTLPSLHGAILRKHLTALTLHQQPGTPPSDHRNGAAPEKPRPLSRHSLGRAFAEYLETRPEDTVPHSGGLAATVVVTMTLESLTGGLKAASLDTGDRISAGEARRLACRAGVIPAVLDGPSVPLDLGRRRRLHTPAQRLALGLRDRGCTAHGCDRSPAWCHAHHDHPWSRGGNTTLASGRLLCPTHHRRIHDPAYQHTLDKHGQVHFTRRT